MIDVPRAVNRNVFEDPPLSWRPVTTAEGARSAIFTCPNGHAGSLHRSADGEAWTIADDGTVDPSVDCSPNGCDFHDHIRLLEWEPA